MTTDQEPPHRLRRLWASLRKDREFRATFIGAIVIPTLCALTLLIWIVIAMIRGE